MEVIRGGRERDCRQEVRSAVVRLSVEERAQLDELIRKRQARILLKADVSELGEGRGDSRIVVGGHDAG
jgi:hypothetical protein